MCRLRGYSCVLVAVHANVVQAMWLPSCISGCAHERFVGYVAIVVYQWLCTRALCMWLPVCISGCAHERCVCSYRCVLLAEHMSVVYVATGVYY